jgi:hypothetical protein
LVGREKFWIDVLLSESGGNKKIAWVADFIIIVKILNKRKKIMEINFLTSFFF